MDIVHECCCGLDVHKKVIVACLLKPSHGSKCGSEIRSFTTMTSDLLSMADWLRGEGCECVAMESTGVYWRPVFNLLEGTCDVLLVNAQHLKAVPGRKTDVADAEWLARCLRHGLVRGSFIPPADQRELRELTRCRTTLVYERCRVSNRLQKLLEDANIKLASVVSDIQGVSARAMLEELISGDIDPKAVADLAKGKLRSKREELEEALTGIVKQQHRFLMAEYLSHLDYLEEMIERVSARIGEQLAPFERELALLVTIPGVGQRTAETVLAEIGWDMSRFPNAHNLASWAAICPGNNQSAGKRETGRIRKGSPWLKRALVEAGHAASHTKDTYLSAQYHRLASKRGKKKALVAVAHSIIVAIYHMLNRQQPYQDLGGNYFDQRSHDAIQRRLVHRLEELGYKVELTATAKAA